MRVISPLGERESSHCLVGSFSDWVMIPGVSEIACVSHQLVENVAVNLDSWRVCESRYEDSRRVQDGTTARAGQPWGGWMVVTCELGGVWVGVES